MTSRQAAIGLLTMIALRSEHVHGLGELYPAVTRTMVDWPGLAGPAAIVKAHVVAAAAAAGSRP